MILYDKLLHISITFMMLVFLDKFILMVVTARLWSIVFAVTITLIMQIIKTLWNYSKDGSYSPYGDWLANLIGYASTVVFWLL